MAVQVLRNCRLYIDGYDLSGQINRLALANDMEVLDSTTFGTSGTRAFAQGLLGIGGSHQGFWHADDDPPGVDDILFSRIGERDILHTIAVTDGAAGDRAYSFLATGSRYTPGGTIGELLSFEIEFSASGLTVYRGSLLKSAEDAVTGNGTGTGLQLGAVATGGQVVSSLHCIEFDGTSLDVEIESDDANSFASATTRITHSQLTDVGSELVAANGPITDTWWRANFTFNGTSCRFAVNVAIL